MSLCISPENCEYSAEGNSVVVVRLIQEGKVLRLKKQDVCETSLQMENAHRELEDEVKIIQDILIPILGKSFVNCPLIVLLKAEQIRMLNKAVNEFRPVHRRHKSVREEDTYVLLLPDYCSLPQSLTLLPSQGPVLCIEIKPKQGFVKEEFLSTFSSKSLPVPMCRFCMMQSYKLKKGTITSRSGYCPTDLFSGSQARMFHALKMLSQTPQNNFRIFKDRRLKYSEEQKNDLSIVLSDFFETSEKNRNIDFLYNLIIQALLKPFPDEMHEHPVLSQKKYPKRCKNSYNDTPGNDDSTELPPFCILETILNCQMLDDLHIADLFKLYLKIRNTESSNYIGCHLRSEFPKHVGDLRKNPNESEHQYASRKVWEFLLALTMKDCSIMIVMRRLVNSCGLLQTQNVLTDKDGNWYIFSIALADLDSKAIHTVEKVHDYMSFLLNL